MLPPLPNMRLALAALSMCFALGAGAAAGGAGFRDLKFTDHERGRTIPVALWYPTADPAADLTYSGAHAERAASPLLPPPAAGPMCEISSPIAPARRTPA